VLPEGEIRCLVFRTLLLHAAQPTRVPPQLTVKPDPNSACPRRPDLNTPPMGHPLTEARRPQSFDSEIRRRTLQKKPKSDRNEPTVVYDLRPTPQADSGDSCLKNVIVGAAAIKEVIGAEFNLRPVRPQLVSLTDGRPL